MSSNILGWIGKILKVDLSSSQISELNTMDYADRFLGGRGIATRIYWENVGPEVSAFDPENHLIYLPEDTLCLPNGKKPPAQVGGAAGLGSSQLQQDLLKGKVNNNVFQ